jgi:hypothetical protein
MAVQGPIPVSFDLPFPEGAFLHGEPGPMRDYERSTAERFVQAVDKHTGELLWGVDVIDADPQARAKTVRVKIAAPVQPVPPESVPGMPFRPVEFEGLTLTPYVDSNSGRLAYSFRATGMRAPSTRATPTTSSSSESQSAPQSQSQPSSPASGSEKAASGSDKGSSKQAA